MGKVMSFPLKKVYFLELIRFRLLSPNDVFFNQTSTAHIWDKCSSKYLCIDIYVTRANHQLPLEMDVTASGSDASAGCY